MYEYMRSIHAHITHSRGDVSLLDVAQMSLVQLITYDCSQAQFINSDMHANEFNDKLSSATSVWCIEPMFYHFHCGTHKQV